MGKSQKKSIKDSKNQTEPNPIGRPTKYDPKYCQEIIEYFSIEPNYEKQYPKMGKFGPTIEYKTVANKMPALHRFAHSIGVCHDTLLEWVKIYPDFSVALKKAKELQKWFLIENGLNKIYDASFAKFVATNVTDMVDSKTFEGDPNKPIEIRTNVGMGFEDE